MYDPKSMKAEEFISHEEVEATLKYADENKDNKKLVEQILEKARQEKGLTHREASVLLACEDEEINERLFALAEKIKKDFKDKLSIFLKVDTRRTIQFILN